MGKISAASPKHQSTLKALHADPKFKRAHSERMKALNEDPKFKKAHSKRMRARNADLKFKREHSERMRTLHADPKVKRGYSERMKALNADPKFAKAHSERGRIRMKALNADSKFAKENSERMKARNADPKVTKENSERMKANRADPVFSEARRKGLAAKPTWPEAIFYGNVFGWLNGTKGFHVQESIPTKHCKHQVDARLGNTIYELDGGGHHVFKDRHEHDRLLDADYAEMGYRVVRATTATDLFLKFLQRSPRHDKRLRGHHKRTNRPTKNGTKNAMNANP